jgi:glycosyltransferase involved in cell wall biosynthesis
MGTEYQWGTPSRGCLSLADFNMKNVNHIAHVISGLGVGGAEAMLLKLLVEAKLKRRHHSVVCLTDLRTAGSRFEQLGIPVHYIGVKGISSIPFSVLKLASCLRGIGASVIQTWLYHSDLLAGITSRTFLGTPVVWGIRGSNLEPGLNRSSLLQTIKLCSAMSHHLPSGIIANSFAGKRCHVEIGYDASKITVIPNGFDTRYFAPNAEARVALRKELNVSPNTILIGNVGRWDPLKDHSTFLKAVKIVSVKWPDVRFVLCGHGVDFSTPDLIEMTQQCGVLDRCYFLGPRVDVPRIHAAVDISTSSSAGEGFPNVIGEAMSCGVPCVATDVGDVRDIIGTTGIVVPSKNPVALAEGWMSLLSLSARDRTELGTRARARVVDEFSINQIFPRFEEVWARAAGAGFHSRLKSGSNNS